MPQGTFTAILNPYLKHSKFCNLEILNLSLLKEIQKIIHNNACDFLITNFRSDQTRRERSQINLRNRTHINIPFCRLQKATQSVSYRAAKLYNLLPQEIKNENSIKSFTKKLKAYYLQQF